MPNTYINTLTVTIIQKYSKASKNIIIHFHNTNKNDIFKRIYHWGLHYIRVYACIYFQCNYVWYMEACCAASFCWFGWCEEPNSWDLIVEPRSITHSLCLDIHYTVWKICTSTCRKGFKWRTKHEIRNFGLVLYIQTRNMIPGVLNYYNLNQKDRDKNKSDHD